MVRALAGIGWILLVSACSGSIDAPAARGAAGAAADSVGPGGAAIPASPVPGQPAAIAPGRVVAHRLNKVEYDNTIRDLIGLDLQPSQQLGFPDDNYVEGFDNNAQALSASPLLLEKYQSAARSVVSSALAPGAPARARILVCDPSSAPDPRACARQILSGFAERAFRRPVTAAEIAPYSGLLDVAAQSGDTPEQGVAAALEALLLSPKFLFRVEVNPPAGQSAPLSDYELASRLSYFLWSSMPDAELMQRAAAGSLHAPDELKRQVARMLADPKAQALTDNLAGEWLGTRELAVKEITLPDVSFDDALRAAMAEEARLFMQELLRGAHPLADLLASDFTFLNQRLALHYGLASANKLGPDMQKVMLTDAARGGGVLTQASFLTVQSQRDRTSPTRRGKWISENLLCVVIPPPPPKIPELVPNDQAMPTSTRERLEAHRRKGSTCNGCHQYMDPLGLAFEHYDAVGRYRETDLGAAIDASGEVPTTNVPFDGATSLTGVLERDARVADCIVRKLLTYALGRSLQLSPQPGAAIDDRAAVADLEAQLGAGTFGELIQLIARSPLMTMRVGE